MYMDVRWQLGVNRGQWDWYFQSDFIVFYLYFNLWLIRKTILSSLISLHIGLQILMARGTHNRYTSNCKQRKANRRDTKATANKRFQRNRAQYARGVKEHLSVGLLNVDGLSASTLDDVANAASRRSLDLIFLLETKRRFEEVEENSSVAAMAMDISIPGYKVNEFNRFDAAHDKMGGGIAVYMSQSEGLMLTYQHLQYQTRIFTMYVMKGCGSQPSLLK